MTNVAIDAVLGVARQEQVHVHVRARRDVDQVEEEARLGQVDAVDVFEAELVGVRCAVVAVRRLLPFWVSPLTTVGNVSTQVTSSGQSVALVGSVTLEVVLVCGGEV